MLGCGHASPVKVCFLFTMILRQGQTDVKLYIIMCWLKFSCNLSVCSEDSQVGGWGEGEKEGGGGRAEILAHVS